MLRLSNIRIGTKLAIMSGIAILLVLGMIGASQYVNSLVKVSSDKAAVELGVAHDVTKIEAAFVSVRSAVRNIRLAETMAELKSANNLETRQKDIDKLFEAMLPQFQVPANHERAEKIQESITQYISTALKETVPAKTLGART